MTATTDTDSGDLDFIPKLVGDNPAQSTSPQFAQTLTGGNNPDFNKAFKKLLSGSLALGSSLLE